MTKEQRLKKRYRAEKRFKMYGLISVSLAVIFVLILVQNIFSKGSSAFSRTMIEVAVNYDSSLLELEGPINQNSLKDADFYDLAVESLLKIYPAKDSKEERQILRLFSPDYEFEIKDFLIKNPNKIDQIVSVKITASDDIDQLNKGNFPRDLPEDRRRVSNYQLNIYDNLIEKEKIRQLGWLELIASENFTSEGVMKATGSSLTNKYAEGYPGKRYYGGCEVVDQIELTAIDRLKELFKVEYANVQPHSGSQANTAVFDAFLKPGDKILGLDLSHGGHLTHGSNVNFSGKIYTSSFYGVTKEGIFDYSEILTKAKEIMPKLIIVGASAYSRDIDFSKFREIADEVGAFLHADIAHPSGLIAKGFLSDPVPYCHVITSTTHKTLRGPRGGIIMMGKDFDNPFGLKLKNGNLKKMSSILDSAIFPGNQGGPLEHVIAAKGIAFGEALETNYEKYIGQVIINAKRLSENLTNMGYNIVSGGTDNHLMLIDLRNKNITGKEAERVLGISNITVNKNMVPFDDQSPFVTSGIRIGTPAITTRGLNEQDMDFVAETINSSIENSMKENILIDIGKKVESYMIDRPLFNS